MKKVIITGGTGFLGYHLICELVKQGVEVLALCRENSMTLERIQGLENVSILFCDLDDVSSTVEKIGVGNYDVLFHLAWEGAAGPLRPDSTTQIKNIQRNCNMAELAYKTGCKKLIVSGTVYEKQCESILQGDRVPKTAFYLLAKKAAYEILSMKCRELNLDFVWCTFYHPIGRYNKLNQLIAETIWKLHQGIEPLFGPANKWFDLISAKDLAHAFYLAAVTELKQNRYYIGSGKPRILSEYLNEIGQMINPDVSLRIGAYPDDGLPMEKEWLDSEPFEKETGFVPKSTLEECIRETEVWVLENL